MSDFTVIYMAPKYPTGFRPWSCRHKPEFVMCAETRIINDKRGRSGIQIDHLVCLACGAPRPCTVGGNVLVDLTMLLKDKAARNATIGMRVVRLRERWTRIARRLFDANGWNGKHERVARMIDPHLTMRITPFDEAGQDSPIGLFHFDREYVREATP